MIHGSMQSPLRKQASKLLARHTGLSLGAASNVVHLICEAVHEERGYDLDMEHPGAHDDIMNSLGEQP